jgi:hypothetical protein
MQLAPNPTIKSGLTLNQPLDIAGYIQKEADINTIALSEVT